MRVHDRHDAELEEFIAARTQDLHHDAYQLTAAQQPAEDLVIAVLAAMRREHIDMTQAGSNARLRMARLSARDNAPTQRSDPSPLAMRFRPLAGLSPRQRAALVLLVIDGYDESAIARDLQLTTRATTEALGSLPYDELPDASPHSGELRSLLEDFGDLANPPSASTTLADVRAVPPPLRRPWWTYVAAFLVIALTVGCLVVTQRWHDDWLTTPDGLNHAHGTHFPAYTQGYKLVGIRDVKPGPAETLDLGADVTVVFECATGEADQTSVARVSSELTGDFEASCSTVGGRQHLTPVKGQTLVAIDDFHRKEWPVAIYRQLSWGEYPVAQNDFTVEHNQTLDGLRPTDEHGDPIRPVTRGEVLTLHGTSNHPNGTFTGTLKVPTTSDHTVLGFSGLLSPTTSGQFQLLIDGRAAWTMCGSPDQVFYTVRQDLRTCSLMDHFVPQVSFNDWGPDVSSATQQLTFTVKHALGPWTLQLVYGAYRVDNHGDPLQP